MTVPRDCRAQGAEGVTACKHTRSPADYIAWHLWAEKKARTHTQHRCPACGLFMVWKRKETA